MPPRGRRVSGQEKENEIFSLPQESANFGGVETLHPASVHLEDSIQGLDGAALLSGSAGTDLVDEDARVRGPIGDGESKVTVLGEADTENVQRRG